MKEQDYKTTARSRLTDRHRSDETFLAILDTLVEIKSQRQKQYLDVADTLLDIDKSEGKNLDLIGKLIGEERTLVNFIDRSYFGFLGARLSESYDIGYWYSLYKNKYGTLRTLTDEEYRRVLKARVVKNSSDNNRNSFLDVVNILLDNDSAIIVESENNTAIEVRIKDEDGLASYYLSKYKSNTNLIPIPLGRRLGVVHTEQDVPHVSPYNLTVEFKNDGTNRLEVNWELDGFVDEQRYYCSETPIDPENLPEPKSILNGGVRTHVDTNVEVGKTYYVRIGAVKNGIEKISDEKVVFYGVVWSPANLSSAAKLWFSSDSVVVDGLNRVGQINAFGSTTITATQANNSSKPLLVNGRIMSDGVDDYMIVNGAQSVFNNVGATYIFSVVNRESLDSVVGASRSIITFSIGATTGYHASLDVGGVAEGQQNQIRVGARLLPTDTYETVLSGFQMEANRDYIIVGIIDFNTRKLELYIDGILVASKTGAFSSSNNTPATDSAHVNLFAQPATPPYVFAGCSLSSLIVNNVALSASDRQKLEGWAAHKYGLTANLPSSHPYKTLVPTL